MRNIECRNTRREIDEAEAHQALTDNASNHLRLCADCRAFREERTRLRDLIGSLEPVNAPADFDFKLRARLAAQTQTARSAWLWRFGVSLPATVAAALTVMLLGGIVWMNQRSKPQNPVIADGRQPSIQVDNSSPNKSGETTATTAAATTNSGTEVIAQASLPKNLKSGKPSRSRVVRSSDYSEMAAQSFKTSDDPGSVSLAAPVRPMVVSMEDDRGATRTISLPPVSFGSQRLVDNRPVSQPGNRIW